MKPFKRISTIILTFFLLALANFSTALAASPDVVNIGVGTKGKYVVVNARLIDGFTESIKKAIENVKLYLF